MTLWTEAHQVGLCFTLSQSLLKLMSTEWMMPSNYRILASQVALEVKNLPASVGDKRDKGLIPGLERSPEYEGMETH